MDGIFLALSSGVIGTGLGGVLAAVLPRVSLTAMGRLLHFTAGLMLAIVCFELIPEAMGLSAALTCLGVFAGMACMLLSDMMLENRQTGSILTTGVMMAVGIALHNLPEGLAVGAGYAGTPLLGFKLCIAIALHDVPEGLAMALPLREGGINRLRVLLITALSGLPTMLGAGAGIWMGSVSPQTLAFSLALAGGAMLQITCQNLLPQAHQEAQGRLESLLLVLGILTGGAACFLL